MAREEAVQFEVVEMNPDAFQVSRLDNFDGTITAAAYCPHKWAGSSTGKYQLMARLEIQDHETGKEMTEYLQAGFLNSSFPSKDGKSPAGGTVEEYIVLSKGEDDIDPETISDYDGDYVINLKRAGKTLPPTDWGQCLKSMLALGLEPFSNIQTLVGTSWHFNRLPIDEDRKREPTPEQLAKGGNKEWRVLCATDKLETPKKKTAAAAKSTAASSKSSKEETEDNNTDDFASEVEVAAYEILSEAGKGMVKKDLTPKITKRFNNVPGAMKRILDLMNDPKWIADDARPWKYEGGEFSIPE